jgi:hypothetical protein
VLKTCQELLKVESAWKITPPTQKVISRQRGTPREGVPKAREDSTMKGKESGRSLHTTTRENNSFKRKNQELKLVAGNVTIMDKLVTLLRRVLNSTR